MLATALLGTGLTPLMPLSFDFGCEILFPVGEAQITGILMTGGQIVGIIEVIHSLISDSAGAAGVRHRTRRVRQVQGLL